MLQIPRAPLVLGLAGLLPFVWGAIIAMGAFNVTMGDVSDGGYPLIVATDGKKLLIEYGTVILAFMSGVLWGFATKSNQPIGYMLSVIPALWAFAMTGGSPAAAGMNLIIGFAGLLLLDWQFWRQGLTPPWWMQLRVLLTTIVTICLISLVVS